ncbi:MAG: ERCC4 domain-containing protein [Thermodesulfobacteriota bacterium]
MNEAGGRTCVLVDDREGGSEVIRALEGYGACLRRTRLSVGDYCLDEELLVERKSMADFGASIVDGRLFKQANRLVSSTYASALLIEGTGQEAAKLNVSREAVQGALVTVSLVFGLPVLRSGSPKETAWLMLTAARQLKTCRRGILKRPGYKPRSRPKRQLYLLQGLPNIGRGKAEKLLDTFGGVQAVMDASYEELIRVKGIGRETARGIREILKEPPAWYGGDATKL